METRCKRFQDISISEKMLYSLFLMTIGIGYLFALTHLYYTHHMRDGEAGLSVQDVMIAYYGSMDQSRLGSAINGGPMEPNLKSAADKQLILAWLQTGKSETQYNEAIAPILSRDCSGCHSPAVNPSLPDLSSYKGVMAVATGKAASLPGLVKVSHIHLFGIAFILLFVGRIFIFCDLHVRLKRVIVVIPFVAMLIDTFSWYVTRQVPEFAYVVVISGGLMGLAMGAQIVISLYQMWLDTFPVKSKFLKGLGFDNGFIWHYLAHCGAFFRMKISPLCNALILNVYRLAFSLYQYSLFKLNDSLDVAAFEGSTEHYKVRAAINVLEDLGYQVISQGHGWLIKESMLSWRFIDSLRQLEQFVSTAQAKGKSLKQAL